MVELERTVEAARLAALADGSALGTDDKVSLGVVAGGTQHKLADEAV